MATTLTPNMSLIIPTVGSEPGPMFAFDINNSLTLIDQHNHTSGKGVQIPSQGLNLQSALTLNNNFLTNVAGVTFVGQVTGTPANATIYAVNNSSGDLYYLNAAGNNIPITNGNSIVGSGGTISGISGTASASYSSPTFFWRSATGIAANMDFASAILRNISPNSTYALTLSPPAALSANYSLTLPPNTTTPSFLGVDGSDNIINYAAVSGGLTGSNLAAATVTGTNIAATTITGGNIAASTIAIGNLNFTPVTSVTVAAGTGLAGGGTVTSTGTITLTTNMTFGATGTYDMCYCNFGGIITAGQSVNGANLFPSDASGNTNGQGSFSGSTTWRCMGVISSGGSSSSAGVSLFVRIS